MSSPTKTILPFTVPRNLPDLVKAAFSRARASGDVNFYPTEAVILHVNALPFQLRFSPSLANKPAPPPPSNTTTPKKPFNPFASPSPSLLITPGPSPPPLDGPTHPTSTHYLLLNKFAIVPHHFILATSAFQPQTHLLEAADLTAAYACIMAYHDYHHAGELFAFFNSGEHSGASQAHRHLQFLEVEGMKAGIPGTGGWEVWADGMVRGDGVVGKLPFRVFAGRVREGMSGEEMRGVYLGLYRQACEALGVEAGEEGEGEARLSYNMAMTRGGMVVMPRVAEGAEVRDREGAVVGRLALNGTVLAGTGLVKSREEWEALRGDPGQVGEVLRRIGVLNTSVDSVQSRAEL
ncbi:hypothetical protein B0T18DRAFT_335210 [Schizothecium vesticola]|uniref:ATP adenylyltransferase n=1 Tax=Schizothecium vesticola TaxID=314040 RepID=A0AA40BQY1_9PEZI|nr:hypothetical protein B0T18DRAFT_335210 [Schizothecium vesticola]